MESVPNKQLMEEIFSYDIILVPMSIDNSMTRGFPHEVAINFPHVLEKECETNYGDMRKYGTIYPIIDSGITFCMCYIHNGGYQKKDGEFVNYSALENCLREVNRLYKGKKVASTVMGANSYDGNGNKEKIISIFGMSCTDIDLFLYDEEPRDFAALMYHRIAELHEKRRHKEITPKEYYELRRQVEWKRTHGIYNSMPDDFKFEPVRKTQRQVIKINKNLVK